MVVLNSVTPATVDSPPAPPPWANVLFAVIIASAMAVLRLLIFRGRPMPFGYSLPLLIYIWLGNRRVMWGLAITCVLITFVDLLYITPQFNPTLRAAIGYRLLMLGLSTINTLVVAALVHWDIGARKQLLERTQQLDASNQRLAGSQTIGRDLEQRLREAEEKSQGKSRFLAAVSHDIRAPANAISLLSELLQRAASDPSMFASVPTIAADLRRTSVSMVDLISDVLDLTRIDAVGATLYPTDVSINDIVKEEARLLVPIANHRGLTLDAILSSEPLVVRTDRVKLKRVLQNLIMNAIKFTETGGIRVRVERVADGDGGGARISVADSGPGIAPENLGRIFDEFFQLRTHAGDTNTGTGLGLAISRRLIDAMGGKIVLDSTPGVGSTFSIVFPAGMIVRSE